MSITLSKVCCFLLLFIAGFMAIITTKAQYPFQEELMDSLHFPAAILLIYCITMVFNKVTQQYFCIFLALSMLVILEIIQPHFGRSAQWQDVLNGLLGVLLFSVWKYFGCVAKLILLSTCLILSSVNLINAVYVYFHTQQNMPSLMYKTHVVTHYGWHPIADSNVKQTSNDNNEIQLSVRLTKDRWQGVYWQNPWLDFSKSHEICFSARASEKSTIQLRIDDVESHDYKSRYNNTIHVTEYWQHFCLEILNINDLNQRPLDKKRIRQLYFFSKAVSDTDKQPWFSLANVRIIE